MQTLSSFDAAIMSPPTMRPTLPSASPPGITEVSNPLQYPLPRRSCRLQRGDTLCNPALCAKDALLFLGCKDPLGRVHLTPPASQRSRKTDPPSSCVPCNSNWRRRILILFIVFVVCLPGRSDRGEDPGFSSSLL